MRRVLSALVVAFACLSLSPAQAGGLLQDLFAPAPRTAPIVHYYAPAQPQMRFLYDEGLRVSRRPPISRKAAVKKAPSKRLAIGRKAPATIAGASGSRFRFQHVGRSQKAHFAKARTRLAHVAIAAAPKGASPTAKIETPAHIDNDPTLRIGDAYMTTEGLRIYRGPSTRAAKGRDFVEFRRSEVGAGVKSQLAALEHAGRMDQARRAIAPVLKLERPGARDRTSVDRLGRVIRVVGP